MAFPFVQVQVNTNNQNFSGTGTSSSSSNNAANNSGAFDSLINEYASSDAAKFSVSAQDNKNLNASSSQQNTLSRPVSQNVLDILAYQINFNNNFNDNLENLNLNNNINSEQLNDLIAEFHEINNNLNLDDENSKLLLANIAEKIISNFSDKLSAENREKLSALAAGLKSYLAMSKLQNSQNSLNSANSLNNINSANLISQNLQDFSGASLNNLISGMSEAEIRSELAKTVQDALNGIAGLNLSQNQAASQAESINYNKALYEHKINFNANNENNDNKTGKEPVSDDEDNKDNDGDGANAKAEHSKLNYEYNYAVLNSVVNQGAAESQPAFFTQDTAEQPELISSDYSASQTSISTSELSSSSSITASTTSSTSLKSQNARSSQSIKETDGGDLKNVRINSQNTDGEKEIQKAANSTGTGTANNGNNENGNGNENNANKNNEQNLSNQDGNIFNNRRNTNNTGRAQGNNNSQLDRDENLNNNRVSNSRQDFQSFFEGVLNNRRTASRIEPAPLNLRPDNNYNYSRSETLRDGIVNVVRFTRADGNYRANMIVDPPALGRITVELTSNTSGVEASIKVVNEQVRQLVQDQITQLRMTLEQQGVQVTQFAVDVQQDNAGRQQNAEQQERRNNRRTGAIDAIGGMDEDNTSEFRIDLEDGLLYWVA